MFFHPINSVCFSFGYGSELGGNPFAIRFIGLFTDVEGYMEGLAEFFFGNNQSLPCGFIKIPTLVAYFSPAFYYFH